MLPVARRFMAEKATAVCLIKPQFEAGKENVGKMVWFAIKVFMKALLARFVSSF